MYSLKNKVNLIGNLGKDVIIRETKNGRKLARFTLATNDTYKDKEGTVVQTTEWQASVPQ